MPDQSLLYAPDMIADGDTMPYDGLITSSYKIAGDRSRLADYLAGRNIFPLSVEFDLTDACNRSCPGCPSVKATTKHFLSLKFIDRLLGILEGQTHGLLFTGGEPTIAPLFSKSLQLARKHKFGQTAVVSNGKCLNEKKVIRSLLDEEVTSLRVSLYDWESDARGPLAATLANILSLRKAIEQTGSSLSIGVSVLTDHARVPDLEKMVKVISECGAHWIYFHPFCENWDLGQPRITNQTGVLDEIGRLRNAYSGIFPVFIGDERYSNEDIHFSSYHAANFLLVIGADGKNYLSPETKYNSDYVLADLSDSLEEDFLWQEERLKRMNYSSTDYVCIDSRHRTVLYNGLIERIRTGRENLDTVCSFSGKLIHPYIL
ncbi:MAG: radical SAM protein [Deltaproteobacteria bacterium]|nr:radical SAM protein [Deltaproteobacteria bacterium]